MFIAATVAMYAFTATITGMLAAPAEEQSAPAGGVRLYEKWYLIVKGETRNSSWRPLSGAPGSGAKTPGEEEEKLLGGVVSEHYENHNIADRLPDEEYRQR